MPFGIRHFWYILAMDHSLSNSLKYGYFMQNSFEEFNLIDPLIFTLYPFFKIHNTQTYA